MTLSLRCLMVRQTRSWRCLRCQHESRPVRVMLDFQLFPHNLRGHAQLSWERSTAVQKWQVPRDLVGAASLSPFSFCLNTQYYPILVIFEGKDWAFNPLIVLLIVRGPPPPQRLGWNLLQPSSAAHSRSCPPLSKCAFHQKGYNEQLQLGIVSR